jgi:hypothetical protein
MALCTQAAWYAANIQYKDWYLQQYPFLKEFPPNMEGLRDFYIDDMRARNLQPLDNFKNCYEFLLSYALENLPKAGQAGRFTGQTFWQRLVKDQWRNESIIWTAFKETQKDLSKIVTVGVPIALILFLIWVTK